MILGEKRISEMCDKNNGARVSSLRGWARNIRWMQQREYGHRGKGVEGRGCLSILPSPSLPLFRSYVSLSPLSLSGFSIKRGGGGASLCSYATDRDHGQFGIESLFNEIIMPGPKCHVCRLRLFFTPTSFVGQCHYSFDHDCVARVFPPNDQLHDEAHYIPIRLGARE